MSNHEEFLQHAAYAEGRRDEREALIATLRNAGFDLRTTPGGSDFLLNLRDEEGYFRCPRCGGAGSHLGTDGRGPWAYSRDVECRDCGGTGAKK